MPSISAASVTDNTNRSGQSTSATSILRSNPDNDWRASRAFATRRSCRSCKTGFPVTFPVRFPKRLSGRKISDREHAGNSRFDELRGSPCTGTLNGNLNAGLNENLNAHGEPTAVRFRVILVGSVPGDAFHSFG